MKEQKRTNKIGKKTVTIEDFLAKNGSLFNLTELERIIKIPNGTLRHIRSGSREAKPELYKKLAKKILPKLIEAIAVIRSKAKPW